MKKIIKLTEWDLVHIIKKVIKEQTLLGAGDAVRVGGRGFDLSKSTKTPSGKTPGTEMDDGSFMECEYTNEEKIKYFFDEAKTWKGSVDEKYINLIIEKMKKELYSYFTGNTNEFLRLLSQIKTEPGMGYLIRTFKLNNKDLFNVLSSDHRFPWLSVVQVLKTNFELPYGPSGCNGKF
jgi:hypothetical protein